jgi:hypothetical protein
MCLGFDEPQRHTWEGSPKVLRRFEGPQVYQPTLPMFSPSDSCCEPLESTLQGSLGIDRISYSIEVLNTSQIIH